MTVVKFVGSSIWVPCLAHDQYIVAKSERIGIESNRSDVDVGIVTGRLAGRRAVEIPFWQILDALDRFIDGLERLYVSYFHLRGEQCECAGVKPRSWVGVVMAIAAARSKIG